MSEYQYYEFRALDRRLTAEQQQRLRSLWSRAEISATRFTASTRSGTSAGTPGEGGSTGTAGSRAGRHLRAPPTKPDGTHGETTQEETWQQVAKLTVFFKPKEYDQATQLLRDLHVIAQREDDITAFTARVRELRTLANELVRLCDFLLSRARPAGRLPPAWSRVR